MYIVHCPKCNKVIRKIEDPKDGDKTLEYCDVCALDFVLLVKLELRYFIEKGVKTQQVG
jgi:hypothetical protein